MLVEIINIQIIENIIMSNTNYAFTNLLIGFKKNKSPLSLYIFGQADPLFGRITEQGKDYIGFTNIPKDDSEATTIYVPVSMICGVVPARD